MLEQFLTWYNGLTDGLWGSLLLFAVGVVLLIEGGDWFVDSAVGIAKRFRVPEIIIGATVVSIGTTLPEVMCCKSQQGRLDHLRRTRPNRGDCGKLNIGNKSSDRVRSLLDLYCTPT